MCGGGTSTTTQQVQIPPDVLARYNSVNNTAQQVASTPFQQYSTDPSAFVAPLSSTQQAGIAGTNASADLAQPYYGSALSYYQNAPQVGAAYTGLAGQDLNNGQAYGTAQAGQALHTLQKANQSAQPLQSSAEQQFYSGLGAAQPFNEAANQNIGAAQAGAQPYQSLATGLGLAGAQAVNPGDLGSAQINKYLSPYLGTVLNSTSALLNQQNQQQQSGQLGDAIRSGAFGGDRAGIAAANLAQQQQLGNASILSGILNQGYGQALGAAQQQQGIGLSADQANRAALQAASGQLQSIGQQGFGQGITAAQAQQGLGNQVYGQYTGTGSALGGLGGQLFSQGSQTAQQQAQIGQDLFGQGLAASQQRAALGNQLYNFGLGAGQSIQGLGTAAQGSALQGAQAQLAAGQQQQQTQQAGQTALYNQFLQQQSYPFQVSQFLANIAEGTGALSGSTTTTTQPAGFFSDKRLKDDIEPIGETYDGQKIVKFRYKGEPNWRMGLIAQEVEKAHPDAVGESHGFKTVDYGKATDAAAKRGKFYRGGLAANDDAYADGGLAANYDPELTRELLANSNGMYGPYLATGTSGPYGGMARVPTANLPTHQLSLPAAPPAMKSGLASAKEIADLGTEVSKDADSAKDAWSWLEKQAGHSRGGLAGYADGGMPYGSNGLDIPDEKPDLKLQTPGAAPKQSSPLSDIADIAKIAALVAGMKRGGAVDRKGFDDGGGVSDLVDELDRRNAALASEKPDFNPRSFYKDFTLPHEGGLNPHDLNGSPTFMGFNQKANPDIDVTKLTPETAADRFTTNYFAPSGAGKLPPQLAAEMGDTAFMNPAKARLFLAQSGGDPDKFMAAREAWQAHMAATNPADAKYGPAWAKRSRDLRAYAGQFASGLGSADAAPDVAAPPPAAGLGGPGNVPQAAPAQAADTPPNAPTKAPWYSHLLDREYLIPALDFLGAMGTAPTRNFGAALAYGAKGAALGLQGQQELAIKRAVAQADILGKTMGVAGSRFVPLGGGQWRDNAQGDIISGDERLHRIQAMPGIGSLVSPTAKAPGAAPAEAPAASANAPAPPAANAEAAPPQTATEAIYAKYDKNPRVTALRSQADTFAKQADDFLSQANDPYVKGTPQAEQLLQAANNAREQAHQYIQQWQQLREQLAEPDVATQTEGQKKRLELQVQAKQEAYDRATQAQNTLQQTGAIIANLRDPNTGKYNVNGGPGGEALAKVGGLMTQFGFSPKLAQMLTGTNPMDAAAVEKLRTTLGTEIGRQELAGNQVRVSEWNQFLKTTPGVDLPAAASEWILKNIIEPRAQQSVGLYRDIRKMDPLKDDIQGATFDFQDKNPWWHPAAGSVSPTTAPIPRNAQGVLTPASPADLKGQKNGTPFIIPSGPNKGKTGYWHE